MARFSSHSAVEKKMIKKLMNNPALFIELDDSWLKNNEFVKTMLRHFPFLIEFAKFHRHDMSFIQQLLLDISIPHEKKKLWMEILFEEAPYLIADVVHQYPLLIEFVSPELNIYSELLLLTALEEPACLLRLENIRENVAFCKLIVNLLPEAIRYVSDYNKFLLIIDNPELFQYLDEKQCTVYNDLHALKNALVKELVETSDISSPKHAIRIIKQNMWNFIQLPEFLRINEDVVKCAVGFYPLLIHFADVSLKYNLEFLKKLIPEIEYPQTRFNNMFNQLVSLDGTRLTSLIYHDPWIMALLPRDVDQFNYLLGIAVLRDASVLQYFSDYCQDYIFIRSVIIENTDVINWLTPEMKYQMIYELPHLIQFINKPSSELMELAKYRQDIIQHSHL
jgi:hypothetical protein